MPPCILKHGKKNLKELKIQGRKFFKVYCYFHFLEGFIFCFFGAHETHKPVMASLQLTQVIFPQRIQRLLANDDFLHILQTK